MGDSILQWFTQAGSASWSKYFTSTYNCVNLGIPGITTDQTIQRLQSGRLLDHPRILPATVPKVCTLMIGTNDIGWGQSEAYIAAQITEIIQILQEKLAPVQILLLGILPRQSTDRKSVV